MVDDLEKALGRELREVAAGIDIPAMPALPAQRRATQSRSPRHWQPLLAAAAVVLVVAGSALGVDVLRDDRQQPPAPPANRPTATSTAIPTTAPRIPYILGDQLFVQGKKVPGSWWYVSSGPEGWLAQGAGGTWWFGTGPEANRLEGQYDVPPVLSPNGRFLAFVRPGNGAGILSGMDTSPTGNGFGAIRIDLGDPQKGSMVRVRAVTDEGLVIAQGTGTSVLWRPRIDDGSVDLARSAPGQAVLRNTPAGLLVVEGPDDTVDATAGEPYLATISPDGVLTRKGAVPTHDDLAISRAGTWLVQTAPGATGGEVTTVPALEARRVDGTGGPVTLTPPRGWGFWVRAWAWEDDEHLVSPVVPDGGQRPTRMTRCSVEVGRCVLVED